MTETVRSVAVARDEQREAVTQALLAKAYDVTALTEEEFEKGLERLVLRRTRMDRILKTALIQGVHFGNPEIKPGKHAFEKKILYQAGAEEISSLLRYYPMHLEAEQVVANADWCSVIVTIGIRDNRGNIVAVATANCNTAEKRFRRKSGEGGTIFDDAREQLHNCLGMAEKRAIVKGVRAAAGVTGFLATEEEMAAALAGVDVADGTAPAAPPEPEYMAEADRRLVMRCAVKVGITKDDFPGFVNQTLGRDVVKEPLLPADKAPLLAALRARQGAADAIVTGAATPLDRVPAALEQDSDDDDSDLPF